MSVAAAVVVVVVVLTGRFVATWTVTLVNHLFGWCLFLFVALQ